MAKTFNPNRVRPGTIVLERADDGTYSSKIIGLESINSLSLPEISTTAAVTKTDTDTKTATEITGDTLQSQTQMAFRTDDDNQIDTTGSMLQDEAKKTSSMLSDTFANTKSLMTSNDAYRGVDNRFDAETFDETEDKISIKDPTSTVFGRPRERTIDQAAIDRQTQKNLGLDQPEVKGSAAVQRGEIEPPGIDFSFLGGDRFKEGTEFARPKEGTIDQAAADNMTQEGTAFARPDRGTIDQMAADSLGITTAKPAETALDTQKFAGSTAGTLSDPAEKQDVKPEVKPIALKTFGTSVLSAIKNIKTPTMMVLDALVGEPDAVQNHATTYFTDRGDGRIGGNPATDLYAGMNRVSAFGNLEKAGEKRLAKRRETIAKRAAAGNPVSQKFIDDTNKMDKQQNDYKKDLDKKTSTRREAGSMNQPGRGGDQSGRSGGKIVCTMMNESYGFGSFRNKIWLRHSKNLAPEYQRGYHRLFLPLVNYAKQKGIINKIIKNILEHIAVHRTIDIRQQERNKIHLIGRVYRTILEPICYWAGKK